ncbi:MAG: PspC domain-containing protein [Patescibacteria group bacterium]
MPNKKIKKLMLPKQDRKIAGVAAAIANYFDIDVTLVRVAWVILLIPGIFPAVIAYFICWLIIPEEQSQSAK